MGAYYTDPENRHKYSGHDYFNLRAAIRVTNSYSVFIRIMNLTDTRYAKRADYTTFSGERYFPGKPRSLYLGIKTRF
ncbi:MAG: TonB-dependent receptor [Alphaproteobacteria bacterium]|nr:TonB-dependent receptor [Alphaproteobacteria bacterium]